MEKIVKHEPGNEKVDNVSMQSLVSALVLVKDAPDWASDVLAYYANSFNAENCVAPSPWEAIFRILRLQALGSSVYKDKRWNQENLVKIMVPYLLRIFFKIPL